MSRAERRHLCVGTVVRERKGWRIGLVTVHAFDDAARAVVVRVQWWNMGRPGIGETALPLWRASRFWRRAGASDRAKVRAAFDALHACVGARASSNCVQCGRQIPAGSPMRWGQP